MLGDGPSGREARAPVATVIGPRPPAEPAVQQDESRPRAARSPRRGLRLLGRRVAHLVVVILIVSFFTALLVRLMPGDPAYALLGDQATPAAVAEVHKQLGLDQNLFAYYVDWLSGVLHGDFGTSIKSSQSVLGSVSDRLPVSLELAVLGLLLALVIAVPAGVYAAYRADGVFDRLSSAGSSALISSPQFLTGILLAYLFAVQFQVFPVTGWTPLTEDPVANIRGAFLPALTLALAEIPVFMRLVRADMIATLRENFILAAAAKGLPPRRVLLRHALRPSSFSLLTLAGVSLGRLIGGTVIVEVIFSLPGVGSLIVDSINTKDLTMVQGIVMLVALAYVLINTAVDVLYGYLDPRLRAGER